MSENNAAENEVVVISDSSEEQQDSTSSEDASSEDGGSEERAASEEMNQQEEEDDQEQQEEEDSSEQDGPERGQQVDDDEEMAVLEGTAEGTADFDGPIAAPGGNYIAVPEEAGAEGASSSGASHQPQAAASGNQQNQGQGGQEPSSPTSSWRNMSGVSLAFSGSGDAVVATSKASHGSHRSGVYEFPVSAFANAFRQEPPAGIADHAGAAEQAQQAIAPSATAEGANPIQARQEEPQVSPVVADVPIASASSFSSASSEAVPSASSASSEAVPSALSSTGLVVEKEQVLVEKTNPQRDLARSVLKMESRFLPPGMELASSSASSGEDAPLAGPVVGGTANSAANADAEMRPEEPPQESLIAPDDPRNRSPLARAWRSEDLEANAVSPRSRPVTTGAATTLGDLYADLVPLTTGSLEHQSTSSSSRPAPIDGHGELPKAKRVRFDPSDPVVARAEQRGAFSPEIPDVQFPGATVEMKQEALLQEALARYPGRAGALQALAGTSSMSSGVANMDGVVDGPGSSANESDDSGIRGLLDSISGAEGLPGASSSGGVSSSSEAAPNVTEVVAKPENAPSPPRDGVKLADKLPPPMMSGAYPDFNPHKEILPATFETATSRSGASAADKSVSEKGGSQGAGPSSTAAASTSAASVFGNTASIFAVPNTAPQASSPFAVSAPQTTSGAQSSSSPFAVSAGEETKPVGLSSLFSTTTHSSSSSLFNTTNAYATSSTTSIFGQRTASSPSSSRPQQPQPLQTMTAATTTGAGHLGGVSSSRTSTLLFGGSTSLSSSTGVAASAPPGELQRTTTPSSSTTLGVPVSGAATSSSTAGPSTSAPSSRPPPTLAGYAKNSVHARILELAHPRLDEDSLMQSSAEELRAQVRKMHKERATLIEKFRKLQTVASSSRNSLTKDGGGGAQLLTPPGSTGVGRVSASSTDAAGTPPPVRVLESALQARIAELEALVRKLQTENADLREQASSDARARQRELDSLRAESERQLESLRQKYEHECSESALAKSKLTGLEKHMAELRTGAETARKRQEQLLSDFLERQDALRSSESAAQEGLRVAELSIANWKREWENSDRALQKKREEYAILASKLEDLDRLGSKNAELKGQTQKLAFLVSQLAVFVQQRERPFNMKMGPGQYGYEQQQQFDDSTFEHHPSPDAENHSAFGNRNRSNASSGVDGGASPFGSARLRNTMNVELNVSQSSVVHNNFYNVNVLQQQHVTAGARPGGMRGRSGMSSTNAVVSEFVSQLHGRGRGPPPPLTATPDIVRRTSSYLPAGGPQDFSAAPSPTPGAAFAPVPGGGTMFSESSILELVDNLATLNRLVVVDDVDADAGVDAADRDDEGFEDAVEDEAVELRGQEDGAGGVINLESDEDDAPPPPQKKSKKSRSPSQKRTRQAAQVAVDHKKVSSAKRTKILLSDDRVAALSQLADHAAQIRQLTASLEEKSSLLEFKSLEYTKSQDKFRQAREHLSKLLEEHKQTVAQKAEMETELESLKLSLGKTRADGAKNEDLLAVYQKQLEVWRRELKRIQNQLAIGADQYRPTEISQLDAPTGGGDASRHQLLSYGGGGHGGSGRMDAMHTRSGPHLGVFVETSTVETVAQSIRLLEQYDAASVEVYRENADLRHQNAVLNSEKQILFEKSKKKVQELRVSLEKMEEEKSREECRGQKLDEEIKELRLRTEMAEKSFSETEVERQRLERLATALQKKIGGSSTLFGDKDGKQLSVEQILKGAAEEAERAVLASDPEVIKRVTRTLEKKDEEIQGLLSKNAEASTRAEGLQQALKIAESANLRLTVEKHELKSESDNILVPKIASLEQDLVKKTAQIGNLEMNKDLDQQKIARLSNEVRQMQTSELEQSQKYADAVKRHSTEILAKEDEVSQLQTQMRDSEHNLRKDIAAREKLIADKEKTMGLYRKTQEEQINVDQSRKREIADLQQKIVDLYKEIDKEKATNERFRLHLEQTENKLRRATALQQPAGASGAGHQPSSSPRGGVEGGGAKNASGGSSEDGTRTTAEALRLAQEERDRLKKNLEESSAQRRMLQKDFSDLQKKATESATTLEEAKAVSDSRRKRNDVLQKQIDTLAKEAETAQAKQKELEQALISAKQQAAAAVRAAAASTAGLMKGGATSTSAATSSATPSGANSAGTSSTSSSSSNKRPRIQSASQIPAGAVAAAGPAAEILQGKNKQIGELKQELQQLQADMEKMKKNQASALQAKSELGAKVHILTEEKQSLEKRIAALFEDQQKMLEQVGGARTSSARGGAPGDTAAGAQEDGDAAGVDPSSSSKKVAEQSKSSSSMFMMSSSDREKALERDNSSKAMKIEALRRQIEMKNHEVESLHTMMKEKSRVESTEKKEGAASATAAASTGTSSSSAVGSGSSSSTTPGLLSTSDPTYSTRTADAQTSSSSSSTTSKQELPLEAQRELRQTIQMEFRHDLELFKADANRRLQQLREALDSRTQTMSDMERRLQQELDKKQAEVTESQAWAASLEEDVQKRKEIYRRLEEQIQQSREREAEERQEARAEVASLKQKLKEMEKEWQKEREEAQRLSSIAKAHQDEDQEMEQVVLAEDRAAKEVAADVAAAEPTTHQAVGEVDAVTGGPFIVGEEETAITSEAKPPAAGADDAVTTEAKKPAPAAAEAAVADDQQTSAGAAAASDAPAVTGQETARTPAVAGVVAEESSTPAVPPTTTEVPAPADQDSEPVSPDIEMKETVAEAEAELEEIDDALKAVEEVEEQEKQEAAAAMASGSGEATTTGTGEVAPRLAGVAPAAASDVVLTSEAPASAEGPSRESVAPSAEAAPAEVAHGTAAAASDAATAALASTQVAPAVAPAEDGGAAQGQEGAPNQEGVEEPPASEDK
ncbi:unnamed protein product [Amoebophrya sp. A25]|nr:unnamed protein product [Amoebophrya sp. A25]|eukprot:GSA25T00009310001.1